MQWLQNAPRPLAITFRKRAEGPPKPKPDSVFVIDKDEADAARILTAAKPAPLPAPPLEAHRPNPPPFVTGGYGASYNFPEEIIPAASNGTAMSTKVQLGELTDEHELDITFMDGPLGMRLDERGGLIPVSLVTHVVPQGQADQAGIVIGCTV